MGPHFSTRVYRPMPLLLRLRNGLLGSLWRNTVILEVVELDNPVALKNPAASGKVFHFLPGLTFTSTSYTPYPNIIWL
jgi:hypothetical protein